MGADRCADVGEKANAGFTDSSFSIGSDEVPRSQTRKMTFASDKLYKGYLRRNMSAIVSQVKVREIIPHLPCLTDHDRENIEAKRETNGNYDSMVLLLDCLKRRENWPEQLIAALEECEYLTLAAEIRREYDSLRCVNNSSFPSATVVKAHINPAPSASRLPIPESGGNSEAIVPLPAEASPPPEPVAQASTPLKAPEQAQTPQSSTLPISSPESVREPRHAAQKTEVAPAPTPETSHGQATRIILPPQTEFYFHQEPVESSETDIQNICGDGGANTGSGNADSVDTRQAPGPFEQCKTSQGEALQTTATTTAINPLQSPSAIETNSTVTFGSSFHVTTPEKLLVQNTIAESSETPVTQDVESRLGMETAVTAPHLPDAAAMDASFSENTLCLSKPGELVSILPQNHDGPTIPTCASQVEPYSGNSERLEISSVAVTSAQVSACSIVSSTTVHTASELPCQENGITLNELAENFYESPCHSLETQEIGINIVQISEEASILDLDGQSLEPQMVNAANEIPSAASHSSSTGNTENNPPSQNSHSFEPEPGDVSPPTQQDSEKKPSSPFLTTNAKYFVTAAGVGACALLMAWKFKS